MLQRKMEAESGALGGAPPPAGGGHGGAHAGGGGGQPLPGALRAKMESSFGADFSAVRVHEDDKAGAVGARAYTQGTDLHFAPGEYQPDSASGQELIGHELAHVVQQSQGKVAPTTQAKGAGGAEVAVNDAPALEHEADAQGARAARGEASHGGAAGAVGGAGAAAPIQRSTGPIQMQKYGSPSDPAISADMAAAGIKNFGPFEWDDTNAKAKMFKLGSTAPAWTWDDCVNRAIYEPELKSVKDEKGTKQGLISQRVNAARKALIGKTKGVIDEIMKHDDGKTPRDVTSLAAEDAASGGHVVERHILGEGKMLGHHQVAMRAAFHKVDGIRMDLDGAGTATVFANGGVALTAVKAAIATELKTNWLTHRISLAKGTQVKITSAVAVSVVGYTKIDSPIGDPYPDTAMPKYIDNSKAGDRELYAGDYHGAGKPSDPNAPDKTKTALTKAGPPSMNSVYVIVDPSQSAPGGWAIYTTYPK